MATGAPVPVPTAPTVLPTASGRTFGPTIQGAGPEAFGSEGAAQLQGLGRAMESDAVQQQTQANEVRVTGALNQLQQARMQLTSDPNEGFMRLQGEQALQPQSNGLSMPDAYAQKLKDRANDIASTLTPLQQQLFMAKGGSELIAFQGDANRWWSKQQASYTAENTKAVVDNAAQAAALNYDSPTSVDIAHNQAQSAVALQARVAGWSPEQTQDVTREALSGVTMSAMRAAIADGNTSAASAMFNAYKDHLTPNALVEGAGIINRQVAGHVALSAADATLAAYQHQLNPDALDAVHAAAGAPANVDDATWQRVLQAESGNRDTNPDGSPVTSPKGARGAAQVMPATASNPGFGVAPSDGTAAGDRQLGRAYLGAMVQRYGNLDQALAAYNAGPGAVDAAIAQAKKDGDAGAWLSHLPAETQAYVGRIAGGATPPTTFAPPKLGDLLADVDQRLGPNATPQQRELAEGEVTRRYQAALRDRQQQAQGLEHEAQTWLLQNNGDLAGMPAALRQQIATQAPEAWSRLAAFAKVAGPGDGFAKHTDPAAYLRVQQMAANGQLKDLSDAEFTQLRTSLSGDDWKQFAKARQNEMGGGVARGPDTVDAKTMDSLVDARLKMIGVNPSEAIKPGASISTDQQAQLQRVYQIKSTVEQAVRAQQVSLGRRLSQPELEHAVDSAFLQQYQGSTPGRLWGSNPVDKPLLETQYSDLAPQVVQSMRDVLNRVGVANPTPDQILTTYQKIRLRNAFGGSAASGYPTNDTASIPAGERQQIVEALEKFHRPVTAENIASLYRLHHAQ